MTPPAVYPTHPPRAPYPFKQWFEVEGHAFTYGSIDYVGALVYDHEGYSVELVVNGARVVVRYSGRNKPQAEAFHKGLRQHLKIDAAVE